MEVENNFLYKDPEERIIHKYSLFKLGEVFILDEFSEKMSRCIKEKINPNKDHFIYATNKHPVTIYCKKCSVLLAEKIAKNLRLPIVIAEYNYSYNKETFYDNHVERKQIHRPHLSKIDREKFQGKKAIFIDDSIVTGMSLQVSIEELSLVTDQTYAFTLIDITENNLSEQDVNNYFEKADNISLSQIINHPNYIFTTHMMRVIDQLSDNDRNKLLNSISKEKLTDFKKGFSVYFGKDYQVSNI